MINIYPAEQSQQYVGWLLRRECLSCWNEEWRFFYCRKILDLNFCLDVEDQSWNQGGLTMQRKHFQPRCLRAICKVKLEFGLVNARQLDFLETSRFMLIFNYYTDA